MDKQDPITVTPYHPVRNEPELQTRAIDSPALRLRGGGASAPRRASRKRKFSHLDSEPAPSRGSEAQSATMAHGSKPSRQENEPDLNGGASTCGSDAIDPDGGKEDVSAPKLVSGKSRRFIVFIGNLPFSATTESIRLHFGKVKPRSIRHSTSKDTGKSKGFAFVEFDEYDRMKTCLKLYHHSHFDDKVSAPRKLNVELTAGGGGRSKARKSKLQAKNEKLREQRKRRAHEEDKKSGKLKIKNPGKQSLDDDQIHPSRRHRVPKAGD